MLVENQATKMHVMPACLCQMQLKRTACMFPMPYNAVENNSVKYFIMTISPCSMCILWFKRCY